MNDTPDRATESADTPAWLEKLQQESWQAEILISGGTLIGLLSLINGLGDFVDLINYSVSIDQMLLGALYGITKYLLIILIVGFLLHLILRGYWIGLIGMNYVFPKGIDNKELAFKGKFSSFIKVSSNTPYLIKLDQVSSLIFVFTFFVIFSFIGFAIYLTLLIAFGIRFGDDSSKTILYYSANVIIAIYIFMGLVGFVDFVSFGRLRRYAWFANAYRPIHTFISFVTLSFLYKRLYYTIASNIQPAYIILILGGSLSIAFGIITLSSQAFTTDIQPMRSASDASFLTVKENVVRDDRLEIAVKHIPRLEPGLITEFRKKNGKSAFIKTPAQRLKLIGGLYEIYIDTVSIASPDWIVLVEGNGLFPVLKLASIINVSNFAKGSHQVKVRIHSKDSTSITPPNLKFYASAYFLIDR